MGTFTQACDRNFKEKKNRGAVSALFLFEESFSTPGMVIKSTYQNCGANR